MNRFVIGCEEWCSLPELDLPFIKVKVDSGAKTSAIHALNIKILIENGKEFVSFRVYPIQNNRKIVCQCKAPLTDRREIKSSNGLVETRLIITTPITIGENTWGIELSLTNRSSMGYRMLLGREAMHGRIMVNPDNSFLLRNVPEHDAIKSYRPLHNKKIPLNIKLLATNPNLYSNRRIMEAAKNRGHNIDFININHCYINIKSNTPFIYHRGSGELKNIDAVIPRLRPSMSFYGCALVRQFKASGVFCLNEAHPIRNSRDKLRCLQILASKNIDLPMTSFANSISDTKHLIKLIGGAPVVIKLLEGTQGKGVILAETATSAESMISALQTAKVHVLVQEFIKEAKGCDIRAFVIDGRIVGSMERKAKQNDFRANLHLGGTASSVKLTKQEKCVAVQAANALGLKVCGVDILRSMTGPKVIEVNSSPGLEGIEKVTKKDIAKIMIECIEKNVYGRTQ